MRGRVLFLGLVAGAALLFRLTAAQGATITVFSSADGGPGTLRQAIFDAASGDTINFAIPQSANGISLSSNELLIDKNLMIDGPGADKLTVQNVESNRIFHIAPASVTVTISGLTIYRGNAPNNENGGGILNAGTLTITNCTIYSNTTQGNGGGVRNDGFLTITNSTISGNSNTSQSSYGGGVANTGTLVIANSTIFGNETGIFSSTDGSGIANVNGGTLTIANGTVAGNGRSDSSSCGGGIFTDSGSITTTRSTIIALNNGPSGPDICGPLISQGFNLVGNNTDAIITPAQSSDLIGTPGAPIDPRLGPLQYNGGPTFTLALQSNSLAVDRGDPNAPSRDQRGYIRAGVSDIGAFEFGGTVSVSLANISTRLRVETGNNVLIGGFIITGAQPKKIIVRAIGPSLSLTGVLADPILELRNSSGGLIAVNDNWRSDQEAEIIATGVPPSNDLESAIVATLPANSSAYTAIVRGVNSETGVGVVEAYDLNRTVDSKLGNISTRGLVQTGDNVMIGGFILIGPDSQKVLVRAIGPSLSGVGIANPLSNPTLELHDGNGVLIASNDNWRSDQEAEIIATTIPPTNDLESAIVRNLCAWRLHSHRAWRERRDRCRIGRGLRTELVNYQSSFSFGSRPVEPTTLRHSTNNALGAGFLAPI